MDMYIKIKDNIEKSDKCYYLSHFFYRCKNIICHYKFFSKNKLEYYMRYSDILRKEYFVDNFISFSVEGLLYKYCNTVDISLDELKEMYYKAENIDYALSKENNEKTLDMFLEYSKQILDLCINKTLSTFNEELQEKIKKYFFKNYLCIEPFLFTK